MPQEIAECMKSDAAGSVPNSPSAVVQLIRLPGRMNSGDSSHELASSGYQEIVRESLASYTHQVGGHAVLVKPKDSSMVLKPFDEAEYEFYDQRVLAECSSLLPFTARCFGEVSVAPSSQAKSCKYVMLEDLAHGLSRPNILDLKMGVKQRSIRNYSPQKVASKEAKSFQSTSHLLGFRIGGAQLYSGRDSLCCYNKYAGREQSVSDTYSILTAFFTDSLMHELQIYVIEEFIRKLESLKLVVQQLHGFRFWSGSILLIYDADDSAPILRMIDFANYTKIESSTDPDFEYLFGIDSLLSFFRAISNKNPHPPEIDSPPDFKIQDYELQQAVSRYAHNG